MAYATVTNLKDRLNITTTDATRDAVLSGLLDASSQAIDGICNRPHGFVADSVASARYFPGSGKAWQRIDENVSVTAVSVKDSYSDTTFTAWTAPSTAFAGDGDFIVATGGYERPEYNRTPYTLLLTDPNGSYGAFTAGFGGRPTVMVTARWGYSDTVPPQVREACIVQASRWWKRGESGWADSVASADMGSLQFRQAIDPDLKAMLIEARLVVPAIG